jgi:predicted flap endonuclease-1-like 5' DNA nuclease
MQSDKSSAPDERLKLLHGLTAMACGQVAVPGEWTFQSVARAAYDEIERLEAEVKRLKEFEWMYEDLCK